MEEAGYTKKERRLIEAKWRNYWGKKKTYQAIVDASKPKFYVLDMFPYPSGAGLHVGHPLGYISSDIVARYKRMKGFSVLHPIGFDTFGLPAEQYAIEHGVHPIESIKKNIHTFRAQLKKIGLSYDWNREVQTCDPHYYKWTQWIFLKFFNSWFDQKAQKAKPITELIKQFEQEGNRHHSFPDSAYKLRGSQKKIFSATAWKAYNKDSQQKILMQYRLAYLAYTHVNWCEALGTVLANEEVINGVSYRGGHPIVKKKMRQWNLRITAYAERLLNGLENVDYSHSMKEIQRNWIGKSTGAEIVFKIQGTSSTNDSDICVFTTRPDTLFGVDFLVLAPEHVQVKPIIQANYKSKIQEYLQYVESRSEVERMAEVKKITGCFTGAYAIHPLSKKNIPIWISEYVLVGYGTGAVMGVPCADERDHRFAKHFNLPITNIIGSHYNSKEANTTNQVHLQNSNFLNGISMQDAAPKVIDKLEEIGSGKRKINYKMRDAGWSRQRYWGEPFPVVYRHDMPYAMEEKDLPLKLPDTTNFLSPGNSEGPLSQIKEWINFNKSERRDSNTMPTHAGAAWYFLRYTDPDNRERFADSDKLNYWNQVDVYVGGSEHAVAHLLYARLVVKVLHDLGDLNFDEPFKKLINQGKIMGDSRFVYRVKGSNKFVSDGLKKNYDTDPLHVDVSMVNGIELDIASFKKWKPGFKNVEFILENGKYICGAAVEKMSKSYFNIVSPDDIIESHGADTLRMYEMFLGPLEQSKPWNTNGLEGVYKFLKKFWNLFHDQSACWSVSDDNPKEEELRILHKTLKKVEWDINHFSFNTSVSEFMICVNKLTTKKCNKRSILEPLTIALSPFAPYITEELWEKLGHKESITYAQYPQHNEKYIIQDAFTYPVSINGKVRTKMDFALDEQKEDMEKKVLSSVIIQKWTNEKLPKKIIIVPGKIINVVL